ncbi:hypothetical protein DL96DRAFT_1631469 [Flagelloscypha sp. PMI_526]|nr:hypothetical protein DL96DRAFT_1631469 [Flagelloscypha sp. PMI_526]
MNMVPTTPYSFHSISVAFLLTQVPHLMKAGAIIRILGRYNNLAPRTQIAFIEEKVKEGKVSASSLARIKRLEACHINAMENLPLFVAAVLAGNFAGLDAQFMNASTGAYLLSRIAYTVFYTKQSTRAGAGARSLSWLFGIGLTLTILTRAAMALSESKSAR